MSPSDHIYQVRSSCFYHIRDLRCIRRYFNRDSAKANQYSLSTRLDYCKSLFSRIADTDLTKLHRIRNRLAHVVTKSSPCTRSVPLLRSRNVPTVPPAHLRHLHSISWSCTIWTFREFLKTMIRLLSCSLCTSQFALV